MIAPISLTWLEIQILPHLVASQFALLLTVPHLIIFYIICAGSSNTHWTFASKSRILSDTCFSRSFNYLFYNVSLILIMALWLNRTSDVYFGIWYIFYCFLYKYSFSCSPQAELPRIFFRCNSVFLFGTLKSLCAFFLPTSEQYQLE